MYPVWHLSLGIIILRFTQVVARISSLFLFMALFIICVSVHLSHSPGDGHCFPQFGIIISNAAKNILAHVSKWTDALIT